MICGDRIFLVQFRKVSSFYSLCWLLEFCISCTYTYIFFVSYDSAYIFQIISYNRVADLSLKSFCWKWEPFLSLIKGRPVIVFKGHVDEKTVALTTERGTTLWWGAALPPPSSKEHSGLSNGILCSSTKYNSDSDNDSCSYVLLYRTYFTLTIIKPPPQGSIILGLFFQIEHKVL